MNRIIKHLLDSVISRFTVVAITLLMITSASANPVYRDLNQIIFSVAWSPDGSKIAIGRFGRIELVNSSTGSTIRTLTGSGGPITAVDWSSDSTRVAGASANPNGVAVWDANSGQMILSRQDDAIDLDWSPDNTQIAFASMQGGIVLWNITSGQINIPRLPGSEVHWSPDGARLVTADYQLAPITVTNLTTSQQVFTMPGHTDGVERIAWSGDGTKIASGGSDNSVRVWNATTGASLFTFTAHTGLVTSVAWNPNNTIVASGSSDGTIRLWDTQTGQPAGLIQVAGNVRSLGWNPSGNKLVYGGDAGIATVIDYPSSTGRGLRGAYYALNNLTGIRFFRLSNQINFNWAASSPEPNIRSQAAVIPVDNFSVRWTGFIEPLYTEAYTFFVNRNDGARLWINGQQIINAWTNTTNAVETASTAITLTAGVRVPITLEYYEATGNAQVSLSWQSARQTKQIVPTSALYPPEDSGSIPEVSP